MFRFHIIQKEFFFQKSSTFLYYWPSTKKINVSTQQRINSCPIQYDDARLTLQTNVIANKSVFTIEILGSH